MDNNIQYDPSEMLEQVRRVDAPPFLLTRIRQQIANARQQVSPGWVWATGLSMALLFAVNIYIIAGRSNTTDNREAATLAQSMNLYPHNSLYE